MPGEVKRAVRVAERVREELSKMLTSEVRDPRLAGVVVTRVALSDDLKNAKVHVRTLTGENKDETLAGLARASGMLRREVTQRVKLRYAPELRFHWDEGQDKLARIERLLAEVRDEEKKKARDD
jgi:ribosome-binding factor A